MVDKIIINLETIKQFLNFFSFKNDIEIRVFDKDKYPNGKTFWVKNEEEFVKKTKDLNEIENVNVYIGGRDRTDKGDKYIVCSDYIFLEVDNHDKEYKVEKEVVEKFLEDNKIKIGLIGFSGGGYHFYIPHEKKEFKNQTEAYKYKQDVLQGFKNALKSNNINIDPKTFNLERVTRILGSYNYTRNNYSSILQINKNINLTENYNNILTLVKNFQPLQQDIDKSAIELLEKKKINESEDKWLWEILKNKILIKEDTGGNSVVFKDAVVVLFKHGFSTKEVKYIGTELVKLVEKRTLSAYNGWVEKAEKNEIGEIYKNEFNKFVDDSEYPLTKYKLTISEKQNNIDYFNVKLKDNYKKHLKDYTLNWEQLKYLMKKHYEDTNELQLLYNDNFKIKGKIMNRLFDDMKSINICFTYYKKNEDGEEEYMNFFDDIIKYVKIDKKLAINYNFYLFYGNNKKYIILSEDELNSEMCEISGVLINIRDKLDVGENALVNSDTHLILVSTVKPIVPKFNNFQEIIELIKLYELNHNKLFNWLFSRKEKSSYRHPLIFEQFLLAFLFSSKNGYDEYPLSLFVMGPQGTGKSWMIEELHEHFDENCKILEGSDSTIKILIPSFKTKPAEPGIFLKSNRICFIDEFFRLMLRVQKEERDEVLTCLNPLLEHKEREFGSGNSKITAKASAKLFAVTNPVYGINSVAGLVGNMDNSFLARLFIWNQTSEHIKEIRNKSGMNETFMFKFDRDIFLGIYDYFNRIETIFDLEKVFDIYNRYINILPVQLADIYSNRYKHHIKCIMDGIIKSRCLFELDNTLTAKEDDYNKLNEIWFEFIKGWVDNDINKLSNKEKIKCLTSVEKYVYEQFCNFNNLWDYQISEKFKDIPKPMLDNIFDKLIKINIIIRDGRKFTLCSNQNL